MNKVDTHIRNMYTTNILSGILPDIVATTSTDVHEKTNKLSALVALDLVDFKRIMYDNLRLKFKGY